MYLVLFCCCPHSKLINSAHLEIRLSKGSSVCLYMSVCLHSSENLFCYSNDFLHDAQIPLQKTRADVLSLSPPGPNSLCFPPLAEGADNQHTSGLWLSRLHPVPLVWLSRISGVTLPLQLAWCGDFPGPSTHKLIMKGQVVNRGKSK